MTLKSMLVVVTGSLLIACSSSQIEPAVIQAQVTPTLTFEPFRNTLPIPNAQVLFNPTQNVLGGWNHVAKFPDEFAGLNFPSGMYRVDRKPALNRGVHQYSTTLIKKYGDWHHQHANGITANYPAIKYSKVEGVELVFKINSDISHLPTMKDLYDAYGEYLTHEQIQALDDGQVHLSIALVGEGAEDITQPTFNADFLLSLEVNKRVDEWHHVFIPRSELNTYTEQNYDSTPLTAGKAKKFHVESFRLMAETASTKVVRNYIPDSYNDDVPKLFKEIGIEIQYIALVRK